MTKLREKAQGQTMQVVGQMIGDDQLVEEGKEQVRHAEQEVESASEHDENSQPAPKALAPRAPAPKAPAPKAPAPKTNDKSTKRVNAST